MKAAKRFVMVVSVVAYAFYSSFCIAQEVTGKSGSPTATTTISGKQLPPPDPEFGGVIKKRPRSRKPGGRRHRAAEGRTQRAAHHDGR